MRDSDVLEKNPHISRSALEALHDQAFGWALSRCDFDRTVAEELVQVVEQNTLVRSVPASTTCGSRVRQQSQRHSTPRTSI